MFTFHAVLRDTIISSTNKFIDQSEPPRSDVFVKLVSENPLGASHGQATWRQWWVELCEIGDETNLKLDTSLLRRIHHTINTTTKLFHAHVYTALPSIGTCSAHINHTADLHKSLLAMRSLKTPKPFNM